MRIVKTKNPEETELASKRAELAALQRELIELELDLSTLEQELAAFRGNYLRIVGRRYAVLDDIKARIAEARAAHVPCRRVSASPTTSLNPIPQPTRSLASTASMHRLYYEVDS